jgi:peptidoglycan/LPS O-acetylase OafA/YrhL
MTPLPALTGLRFAAAAAVALSHLWYVAEHPALPAAVRRLIAEGPAGVSFFFVLSGFVLAVNYRDRFPALTRGRLLPYYAARVGRIWPSHLVVLALAVAFPYLFWSPPPLGGRVRVGGDTPPPPGTESQQWQAATPHPNPPPQGGRGPEKQGGGWELAAVGGLLVLAAVADRVPPLVRANGYYTPMMAAVVWAFAAGGGRLSKLFASRPAVALGEISFAFYLLHCLVFFHAHRLVGVEPLTPAGLAVGSVLAALLLSAGLHRGVETPARGWVVRAAARTQAARPVSGRGLPFGRHVWGVR